MSYLQLSDGIPDFSKAVISLWFRIPQESIDKVAMTGEPGTLDGIIPLVIMGIRGAADIPTSARTEQVVSFIGRGYTPSGLTGHDMQNAVIGLCPAHGPGSFLCSITHTYNLGAYFVLAEPFYGYTNLMTVYQSGDAPSTNPTCIGIDCSGSEPKLFVNFETDKAPVISNYRFNTTITMGPPKPAPGDPNLAFTQGTSVITGCSIPLGLQVPFYDIEETSDVHTVYPPDGTAAIGERSYTDISMFSNGTGEITSDEITVTSDAWHHALISVELKTIRTHGIASRDEEIGDVASYVDSAAQIFVALDDKNFTGFDLSSNWPDGSSDLNAVIPRGALNVAGSSPTYDENGKVVGGRPEYTLDDPKVPCVSQPIGLPGTAGFVNKIHHVEMAELQIFLDVALDTGIEANRRAFIDYVRDASGKPIEDADKRRTLQPVDPANAEKLLGKKPDILLHGSGNWIRGQNTGTLAPPPTVPPAPLPPGWFSPTGVILAYTPDPAITVAPPP